MTPAMERPGSTRDSQCANGIVASVGDWQYLRAERIWPPNRTHARWASVRIGAAQELLSRQSEQKNQTYIRS